MKPSPVEQQSNEDLFVVLPNSQISHEGRDYKAGEHVRLHRDVAAFHVKAGYLRPWMYEADELLKGEVVGDG